MKTSSPAPVAGAKNTASLKRMPPPAPPPPPTAGGPGSAVNRPVTYTTPGQWLTHFECSAQGKRFLWDSRCM